MVVPSTTYQLLILVGLVLPGIVFAATLARLRGLTPATGTPALVFCGLWLLEPHSMSSTS